MFEKAQFTLVIEHFEAIFDKDISRVAISRQRLYTHSLNFTHTIATITGAKTKNSTAKTK